MDVLVSQAQSDAAAAATRRENVSESADQATIDADFESFLQLLTAQLRNQDPLSPLDSTQFVAQLASFSTVEQLVNANTRLDALVADADTPDTGELAALIGRHVELEGEESIYADGAFSFRLTPRDDATRVRVSVTTIEGEEVGVFDARNLAETQTGSVENLAPGPYRLTAQYFTGDELNNVEPVRTTGRVSAVSISEEGASVRLENGSEWAVTSIVGLFEPDADGSGD